ncbi:MAG: PAS domain-containing protein, partial [Rhodocyclaceae bacterium]|nr:PAS domain-containing protein [Rhodocyclaceae bacterium]
MRCRLLADYTYHVGFGPLAYVASGPTYAATATESVVSPLWGALFIVLAITGATGWLLFWRERQHRQGQGERDPGGAALIRTVLDVIPEPVLVKDRHMRLIMANRAYAARAGLPADALIGKAVHALMPTAEAERVSAADTAVLSSKIDQVFELSLVDRVSNTVRNYIVTERFARSADGEDLIVGIHHDVTELRRAIAEFSAAIEQTPLVAVQGFNRNCVLTHWNKASENLFGFTASQALGSRLQDIILEPRQQQVFERAVEDAWVEKRPFGPREVHLRLPNGRRLTLLLTLFPVVIEGAVVELFSMAVDVSARVEAERQLAMHRDNLQALVTERTAGLLKVKHDLEQALHARSAFLANMSHELRTPMHAVLSFARLGEERADKGTPEKMRDYFSRIVTSGERLLVLINNLLDLSKFEAGMMILQPQETDLVALLHEVADEYGLLLEKQGLRLTLPQDVPVCVVSLDRLRIRQVIANLLSNAIRFSPQAGRIDVSLSPSYMRLGRRVTDTEASPAICLSIADEGPGIPPGELELIFEKFVQSS